MSETQSQSTGNAPNKHGSSHVTRSSHARTAKIRRTREVIERVEIEHVAEDGEPPVTTTAEQRVLKSTNMERGKHISDEAPQEQITSRKQPGRAAKKGSQTQVDIPIQAADTSGAAPAAEAQQEGPHHMSTQDYMEEAEELLTHPMPETQPEDTVPEVAVAADEEVAAGNLAEQTPEDAAAAGEHLAEHIQPGNGAEAPAPEEQPSADVGANPAAPPAGNAGLVGRVAQVGRRIVRSLLHPDDAGAAAAGEEAGHGEGETAGQDQAAGVVAAVAEGGGTGGQDQAVGVVAATIEGGKREGGGQAVEEVAAVAEVGEGVAQQGSGQIDESAEKGVHLEYRTLAEVAAEVEAQTAQADMGDNEPATGNQEDAPLLAEVVALHAVSAEDEGHEQVTGDEEEAPIAEAPALAETALEGESAAVLQADTSVQPAAGGLGGTTVEGADEDEAPAAAPEVAGLAAQEGLFDSTAPAVLAQTAASEPGASLEKAADSAEPAAVAHITVAEVADENAANAAPALEPAATAEVVTTALAEHAGIDVEAGAAAAAGASVGDGVRWPAAAADVAAVRTPEGAHGTTPAKTSFDTAHDKDSAQAVSEVAEAAEEVFPAVIISQGATAEFEDLTAAASLAAEDLDNEPVGTLEDAEQARRVLEREDLVTAAALAMQDFDVAEGIAAEQALITAAVLAADDFAEADETDKRAARSAAEQALITSAVVAAEQYSGRGAEPGWEDLKVQAVRAEEGDEGDIEGEPVEEEEQPAADTQQEYCVEEPEQSAEEEEAPAQTPVAPKGRGGPRKITKRAATQAAGSGAEASAEPAEGAEAKKDREGAKKLKPYTPAKMAAMRGSPNEVRPVEEVLTQPEEEAAPAPRTPPAKRGRPAAPKTPPKSKGHANPAKELLEAEAELEAPPATAEGTAGPSKRGRGQPSKAAAKSSPPAKRSRAETSKQTAREDKSKKAQESSPKSPPSEQAGQGRAGASKAPKMTPAAPTKAPRKAPPAKSPAAAAKKAPVKGPSKVPCARAAGVQKRPARQSGSRRKERPESFKIYLHRVLKEIHPDISLSNKAITVLDNFTKDMHNKIANEAADLCRRHNRATLSSREIDAAVRFLLPGELFNHAVSEGRKAVARALSSSE